MAKPVFAKLSKRQMQQVMGEARKPAGPNYERMLTYWTHVYRVFAKLPKEEGRRLWVMLGIMFGFKE